MSLQGRGERRLLLPDGVIGWIVTPLAALLLLALIGWMTLPRSLDLPAPAAPPINDSESRYKRWFQLVSKVSSWLVTFLVALLLLAFIAWMMLPRILNVQALIVLTGSMEPALPVGSVAFVEKSGAGSVKDGDIITFYRPDADSPVLVTHRVVEVVQGEDGRAFRTQGDANVIPDDWLVPSESVVGEVRTVIPYVGHLTDKVRGRDGFLALMAIPGALIILGEIGNIRHELRLMREKGSTS